MENSVHKARWPLAPVFATYALSVVQKIRNRLRLCFRSTPSASPLCTVPISSRPIVCHRHWSVIARRKVSLIRSCQPGPSSWKWSSTALSILIETSSLMFGADGSRTGAAGFLIGLKAASAADIGFVGRRGGFAI